MKKQMRYIPANKVKDIPYHESAPLKKGTTVYKTNSTVGDLYPDGTRGKTLGAILTDKGVFCYLVEFYKPTIHEDAPGVVIGVYSQVNEEYLTTEKPTIKQSL